jgi:hypothetical protein
MVISASTALYLQSSNKNLQDVYANRVVLKAKDHITPPAGEAPRYALCP